MLVSANFELLCVCVCVCVCAQCSCVLGIHLVSSFVLLSGHACTPCTHTGNKHIHLCMRVCLNVCVCVCVCVCVSIRVCEHYTCVV